MDRKIQQFIFFKRNHTHIHVVIYVYTTYDTMYVNTTMFNTIFIFSQKQNDGAIKK